MNSTLNPIVFALRHPITILAAVAALAVGSVLAVQRMAIDIFPTLNLPVIYVAQPYGGMDPAQMEGLITNYYEYHFLYISGIHHVESQEHPGLRRDEALLPSRHRHGPGHGRDRRLRQPRPRLHAAGHRAAVHHPLRHRQRPGRLPRADSDTDRSIGEIQDLALFSASGRCSPACPACRRRRPFGGNQRTIVVNVDPDRLRAYNLSADDVVAALTRRQHRQSRPATSASRTRCRSCRPTPWSSDPQELGNIPIKPDATRNVYLRDLAHRRGRHRHPDRLRPGQRQAGRLHPGDQAGRRLHAGRGQRRQGGHAARCRQRPARGHQAAASSSTSRPTSPAPCGASASEGVARRRADRA